MSLRGWPYASHQVAEKRHGVPRRHRVEACPGGKGKEVFHVEDPDEKVIGAEPRIVGFGGHREDRQRSQVEECEEREEGKVVQQGSGCVSANNKSKKQLGESYRASCSSRKRNRRGGKEKES